MTAAKLSEDDKAAIKSGFPALIYARLAGLSVQEAFKITLRPPVAPQQFVFPVQMQQPPPYGYPPQPNGYPPQPYGYPQHQYGYQQMLPQFMPQFIYPQWHLMAMTMAMVPPQFLYPLRHMIAMMAPMWW